jgi:hypothetical protein
MIVTDDQRPVKSADLMGTTDLAQQATSDTSANRTGEATQVAEIHGPSASLKSGCSPHGVESGRLLASNHKARQDNTLRR